MERWMARVAPVAAKFDSVSRSGIADARPLVRVRTSDCATPGNVSSCPSAAAAAAKEGTPGVIGEGDAQAVQTPQLLAHCAPDGQIAGMQPGHIVAFRVGLGERGDYLVERERRGVDDTRARRTMCQECLRDERPGKEADRALGDQVAATDRDEVGRAGAGADEVDCHGGSSRD